MHFPKISNLVSKNKNSIVTVAAVAITAAGSFHVLNKIEYYNPIMEQLQEDKFVTPEAYKNIKQAGIANHDWANNEFPSYGTYSRAQRNSLYDEFYNTVKDSVEDITYKTLASENPQVSPEEWHKIKSRVNNNMTKLEQITDSLQTGDSGADVSESKVAKNIKDYSEKLREKWVLYSNSNKNVEIKAQFKAKGQEFSNIFKQLFKTLRQ